MVKCIRKVERTACPWVRLVHLRRGLLEAEAHRELIEVDCLQVEAAVRVVLGLRHCNVALFAVFLNLVHLRGSYAACSDVFPMIFLLDL